MSKTYYCNLNYCKGCIVLLVPYNVNFKLIQIAVLNSEEVEYFFLLFTNIKYRLVLGTRYCLNYYTTGESLSKFRIKYGNFMKNKGKGEWSYFSN